MTPGKFGDAPGGSTPGMQGEGPGGRDARDSLQSPRAALPSPSGLNARPPGSPTRGAGGSPARCRTQAGRLHHDTGAPGPEGRDLSPEGDGNAARGDWTESRASCGLRLMLPPAGPGRQPSGGSIWSPWRPPFGVLPAPPPPVPPARPLRCPLPPARDCFPDRKSCPQPSPGRYNTASVPETCTACEVPSCPNNPGRCQLHHAWCSPPCSCWAAPACWPRGASGQDKGPDKGSPKPESGKAKLPFDPMGIHVPDLKDALKGFPGGVLLTLEKYQAAAPTG